ncbi:MAG TPA: glycosyltransferase family 87 protein [candidate division Zixibacteria bacterium]|nr:glycosyltransferase family 87 protein [candidate division Zixibacteria bacterium]
MQPNFKYFRLVMTALALLSLLFNAAFLWSSRDALRQGYGDFLAFYAAARLLKAHGGGDLYNLKTQEAFQKPFEAYKQRGWPLPYIHPPFELLWLLPFTALAYPQALAAWLTTNVILVVATFALLTREVDVSSRLMFASMFAGFFPVTFTLFNGQDSIILLFLIAAACAQLEKNKDNIAGILLGFALIKPQLIFAILLLLLYKRRWRFYRAFAATAIVLAVVSIALVGPEGVRRYIDLLITLDATQYTIAAARMSNIRAFVEFALSVPPPAAKLGTGLLTVGFLAFLLYKSRGNADAEAEVLDLQIGLAVVVGLVTSYHAHLHDLSLLLVPITALTRRILLGERPPGPSDRWFLFLTLCFWVPFPGSFLPLIDRGQLPWLFLPLISFAAFITHRLDHERCRSTPRRQRKLGSC